MIKKCDNRLIGEILGKGSHCSTETNYLENNDTKILHFYFINNYINILNYHKPNSHFFYRIETNLYEHKYIINDINISPVLVKTHNGLIFDHIKEETSYMFDRNDVYIENNNENTDLYIWFIAFF